MGNKKVEQKTFKMTKDLKHEGLEASKWRNSVSPKIQAECDDLRPNWTKSGRCPVEPIFFQHVRSLEASKLRNSDSPENKAECYDFLPNWTKSGRLPVRPIL